jgi:hypothetical protein
MHTRGHDIMTEEESYGNILKILHVFFWRNPPLPPKCNDPRYLDEIIMMTKVNGQIFLEKRINFKHFLALRKMLKMLEYGAGLDPPPPQKLYCIDITDRFLTYEVLLMFYTFYMS